MDKTGGILDEFDKNLNIGENNPEVTGDDLNTIFEQESPQDQMQEVKEQISTLENAVKAAGGEAGVKALAREVNEDKDIADPEVKDTARKILTNEELLAIAANFNKKLQEEQGQVPVIEEENLPPVVKEAADVLPENVEAAGARQRNTRAFKPKRAGRRSKWSFGSFLGAAFGKVMDYVVTPVTRVLGAVAGGLTYGVKSLYKRATMSSRDARKIQKAAIRAQIPGAPLGETFQDNTSAIEDGGEDQPILIDRRRVPMVWEKLTAENPEALPEFTVYGRSDKYDTSSTELGQGGQHTSVSLSYSRINKLTGKKERYRTRFGFYSKGGTSSTRFVFTKLAGIVNPGELRDDTVGRFDFSRRYQINNKQVNQAFASAERHAYDGYNIISNNCTTFVKRIANDINLDVSDSLKNEVIATGGAYAADFLVEGAGEFARFMTADYMTSRLTRDDRSYQGFGQKQFTSEDISRNFSTGILNSDNSGYTPFKVVDSIRAGFYEKNMADSSYSTSSLLKTFKTVAFAEIAFRNAMGELSEKLKNDTSISPEQYEKYMDTFSDRFNAVRNSSLKDSKDKSNDLKMHVEVLKILEGDIQNWFVRSLGASEQFWRDIQNINTALEECIRLKNEDYAQNSMEGVKGGDLGIIQGAEAEFTYTGALSPGSDEAPKMVIPLAFIAAGEKVFGSSEKAANAYMAKYRRSAAIPNEEKEKAKITGSLGRQIKVVEDFMSAQTEYMTMDNLSDTDLKYIFEETPSEENPQRLVISTGREYLQSLLLVRYFSGTSQILKRNNVSDQNKLGDDRDVGDIIDPLSALIVNGIKTAIEGDDKNLIRAMGIYLSDILGNREEVDESTLKLMAEKIMIMITNSYLKPIMIKNNVLLKTPDIETAVARLMVAFKTQEALEGILAALAMTAVADLLDRKGRQIA